MPLAVSGQLLELVDGKLSTACCCGPDDGTGDWWCLNGKCTQSELAPDGPWVGRYRTLEACERRCLNNFDCGCCAAPNPLTGICEECDEACNTPSGEECDTEDCEVSGEGSASDCNCETYPPCAGRDCGCCMQCVGDPNGGTRCVPCPDDTICVDPDGSGLNCRCVPFEECEADPLLCVDQPPRAGFGWSCSRNLCGDGDCRYVRGGTYPFKYQCLRACRDEQTPDCGLRQVGQTFGGRGTVRWTDYHYAIQPAAATVNMLYTAQGYGLFRFLLRGPMLDRECRTVATSVVHRDTGWRCVKPECGDCLKCPVKGEKSRDEKCKEADPAKPYCCVGTCQAVPCECKRCPSGGCNEIKSGRIIWRKPRGVTYFSIRLLYDTNCGTPRVCWDVACPNMPDKNKLASDCDATCSGPSQCCVPVYGNPEAPFTCEILCEKECKAKGGIFTCTPFPCEPEGACCVHSKCGTGYAESCPDPCCCDWKINKCYLPPPNEDCEIFDYPACCLPGGGCRASVPPEVCAALGGITPPNAGITCRPGMCCPLTGSNDCPAGFNCCGTNNPFAEEQGFSCCSDEKCCTDTGQCVGPPTCEADCTKPVGPKCAPRCAPCEELNQCCKDGECVACECDDDEGCPEGKCCSEGSCGECAPECNAPGVVDLACPCEIYAEVSWVAQNEPVCLLPAGWTEYYFGGERRAISSPHVASQCYGGALAAAVAAAQATLTNISALRCVWPNDGSGLAGTLYAPALGGGGSTKYYYCCDGQCQPDNCDSPP
jgi:hypothetical protein